jgi:hypothetical protein
MTTPGALRVRRSAWMVQVSTGRSGVPKDPVHRQVHFGSPNSSMTDTCAAESSLSFEDVQRHATLRIPVCSSYHHLIVLSTRAAVCCWNLRYYVRPGSRQFFPEEIQIRIRGFIPCSHGRIVTT